MKYNNINILKTFIKNNLIIVIPYIITISLILPIESIGFSKYTTSVINAVKNKNAQMVIAPLIMISVIYITTRILHLVQQFFELHINANLTKDVRENLFSAYIKKFAEKYKEAGTGKVISKLNVVPHIYEDMVYEFLHTILPYGITIIILSCYFFTIDKRLGIFLVVSVIFMLFIIIGMAKRCMERDIDKFTKYYELNDTVQDKMSNIYTVIANDEVDKEVKDSKSKEDEYKKVSLSYELKNFNYQIILNIIIFTVLVTSLVIYYRLFKTAPTEKVIASFLTFFYLLKYINSIKWNLLDFLSKFGLLSSIEKDFVNTGPVFKGGNKVNFITKGNINIKNINFAYDNKTIHNNMNMNFMNNKITTIFGKSGSGKTTILKLLMGFYDYKGQILYDNTELRQADISYLRNNIAVVNQNIKLFNKSVYDNIMYSTQATKKDVDDTIEKLNLKIIKDLEKSAGVNGSELSNGQKQFVLLMRAFLKNKKILILDEPTSSLDKDTKGTILDTIKKISANKTTIIVTHDNDIKGISDNIYYLSK